MQKAGNIPPPCYFPNPDSPFDYNPRQEEQHGITDARAFAENLQAMKAQIRGTYVAFASSEIAEQLAGSVAGTILPFSFNPKLELVVDPSLLENDEIYFNAARLDRSLVLKTSDYVALAKPRLGRIAASRGASGDASTFP